MPASSASSIAGTSNRGERLAVRGRVRSVVAAGGTEVGAQLQIGRVIGTVVATQKHRKFEGAKLLLVQPLNVDDTPRGAALLAVDGVGAGVNEKVLIVLEGRAAGEALGKKAAPVDAAIVGIIDSVTIDGNF
jgi:microcompartment protein CcmK/EutM